MAEERYIMSKKELDRAAVMEALDRRLIKQKEASRQLGVSPRQIKRLLQRYCQGGSPPLISRRRGAASNRCLCETTRSLAMDWVRTRYRDFGPTFAHEKLTEDHGLNLSVETLRQWMMAEGLWQPKGRKAPKAFQMRERRPWFGELIQNDGFPHRLLEDRGPACTLIVFFDDATGQLLSLRLVSSETTPCRNRAFQLDQRCGERSQTGV